MVTQEVRTRRLPVVGVCAGTLVGLGVITLFLSMFVGVALGVATLATIPLTIWPGVVLCVGLAGLQFVNIGH